MRSEEINRQRRRFIGAAAMTTAAVPLGMFSSAKAQSGETKSDGRNGNS
jgi:hypothetical protein